MKHDRRQRDGLDPLFPDTTEEKPCTESERILILKRAINIFYS
jgi:hypothetical protein